MLNINKVRIIQSQLGRAVYSVSTDSHNMLVFYTLWDHKFHGILEDGTLFKSTNTALVGTEWFDTLCDFFENTQTRRIQ